MASHFPVGFNLQRGAAEEEDEKYIAKGREIAQLVEKYLPRIQKGDYIKELAEHSTKVVSFWRKLRQILDAYETTIRRRWDKKSKAKRSELLKASFPEIPVNHAPELDVMRASWVNNKKPKRPAGANPEDAGNAIPCINLEDLVQGMFLPLFMNSRGRHPPNLFAHTDLYAMHFGLNMHFIFEDKVVDGELPWDCAVLFKNPDLGEYTEIIEGKSFSSKGPEAAMEALASGQAFPPGRAGLILRAQHDIFGILLKCCSLILHDIPIMGENHHFQMLPEPGRITPTPSQRLNPIFAAIEAPYRLPGQFNFERIEALINARQAAAEDNIWSLREDPSYFAGLMNCQVVVPGRFGRLNLYQTKGSEALKIISISYEMLFYWNSLRDDFRSFKQLEEKFSAKINPEKQLPPEYQKALMCFWDNLARISDCMRRQHLRLTVMLSPTFRHLVTLSHREGYINSRVDLTRKAEDMLFLLLYELTQNSFIQCCSLPDMFNELERHLILNPSDRDKLTNATSMILSDLGILAQITRELYLYQPWASKVDWELKSDNGVTKAITELKWKRIDEVAYNLDSLPASEISKVGMLVSASSIFDYPISKRPSRARIEAIRQAEEALDTAWDYINQVYLKRFGQATLVDTLQDLFSDERQLIRTPEWTEPPLQIKRSGIMRTADEENLISAFEHVRIEEIKAAQPPNTESPKVKAKFKTRKEQPPSEPSTATEETSEVREIETPQREVIKVNKRIYRVFTGLFYTPSEKDPPGEIAWQDFLQAMAAGGLTAEPLYGSIWHFTPQGGKNGNMQRSIQFHQPHPGKLRFETARFFGRRLNRAFGWDIDSFALE